MTTPGSPRQAAPVHDWPDQVADRIESVVGAVRDKTTVPVTLVARGLVYGVVVGALGVVSLLLVVIVLVRLGDVYLPYHPLSRRVWTVDAGASAIFLGAGALAWSRRRPRGRS
ncbi:MAG: hypothetical protein ACP5P1_10515 [Acidimicrobiales bacterium]